MSMLTIRHLTVRDIPYMMPVNARCFPNPWSEWSIKNDLLQNPYSEWILLEEPSANHSGESRLNKLWSWFHGAAPPSGQVVGFGGFWIIYGEMHITNIGIDPAYQGQGLGEVLLLTMLKRAITVEADYATLEVRVSNERAINLYHKYAYQIVGRKRGYYQDNQEDAFDMATDTFDRPYVTMLNRYERWLHQRIEWLDKVTKG